MFILSKLLGPLCHPLPIAYFLIGIGMIVGWTTHRRLAQLTLMISFITLTLMGYTPLPKWGILQLESRYPHPTTPIHHHTGMIVLGGGVHSGQLVAKHPYSALGEGAERLTTAYELLQRYPHMTVILSGYSGAIHHSGPSESEISRQWLIQNGIAANRIIIETTSRNTKENARAVATLLQHRTQPWLLITSAYHMPRAARYFQQSNIPFTPFPVDYQLPNQVSWFNLSAGSYLWGLLLHEWIGLWVQKFQT